MSHRVTIKGQVTIPKEIREFLGLEEGNSCVEFAVEDDGTVTVRKAEATRPRFERRRAAPTRSSYAGVRPATGGVLALLAGGL